MRTRFRVISCAALAACALVAHAIAADPAPAPGPTPSAREAAARDLFRVFGGMKTAEAGAEAMLTAVRTNPQLAPYEDVFRQWYMETMAKSAFESKIVALYAETFSEQELKDLTAFYQSPLGKKALAKMPELMKRGSEIGVEIAKANQGELERRLEERRKQLEADSKSESGKGKAVMPSTAKPTPAPTRAPRS